MKEIPLSKGFVAIVDDEDFEELSRYKWHVLLCRKSNSAYANRSEQVAQKKWRKVQMHRQILNAEKGVQVDHINGDGLDNRRSNLRLCTQEQNLANRRPMKGGSSKYKGVCWVTRLGKWVAQCTWDNKVHYLGAFDEEKEVAEAYDEALKQHRGKFALTNEDVYGI